MCVLQAEARTKPHADNIPSAVPIGKLRSIFAEPFRARIGRIPQIAIHDATRLVQCRNVQQEIARRRRLSSGPRRAP